MVRYSAINRNHWLGTYQGASSGHRDKSWLLGRNKRPRKKIAEAPPTGGQEVAQSQPWSHTLEVYVPNRLTSQGLGTVFYFTHLYVLRPSLTHVATK